MNNIQTIIDRMTLEEKAALCIGATAWTTTAIPRLGVPELVVSDGPHGVRRVPDANSLATESLPATCFPTASSLASTWDIDLIADVGQAIAEECIALKVDVILGPGNNMKRSPLCGRNFEYYSEDPYLSGQLAAHFINGVQSKGVGTSLKHFAANNQEFQRFSMNTVVDERTLREIYLPAFETAVKESRPWTVMCAYNKLNGTYCSEHHELLTDILKQEWGFDGLIVSDWGAVHDRVEALHGGLDLEMPGPRDGQVKAVIEAVRGGQLPESLLDESVSRILGIVFRAAQTPKGGVFDHAAHHALARRAAAEGMVLLKNNGLLPLQKLSHIAVIGRSAQFPHYQGGGSSHINPTHVDIPFVELQKRAEQSELSYCDGYPSDNTFQQALIDQAVTEAQSADVALLFIALPSYKESEGYDRPDLDLTVQQVALIKAVSSAQSNTVVVLNNGSAVTMDDWIDGPAAVLEAWMMGQAGGGAVADVLFGVVNPSGKLAETFPQKLADTPAFTNFPGGNGEVRYGEGIFIGYRYYDAKQMPVQFPFGYGGSYTTFEYGELGLSASNVADVDGLTVSVNVTNTGKRAGKETVQVYVRDHQSKLIRPPKELKGFVKLDLQPGETKKAEVHLNWRAFAYYHPGYHQWITEDGDFDILVGSSSADIHAVGTVTLRSTLELPSILNRESTLRDWLEDARGRIVLEPIAKQMQANSAAVFGSGNGEIGMDMNTFLMDLPLRSILQFQEKLWPVPVNTVIDDLLQKVYSSPA